jgi:hypothetical protein
MKKIDVIILTKSDTEKAIRMTKRTMLTMQDAENDFKFNFHLVESGIHMKTQYEPIVKNYITPNESFNYNRFLNHAVPYLTSEWVIICNNDVGFEKGWFSEIMKIHELRPDIHSFSPKDPVLFMKWYDWHFVQSPDTYFESHSVTEALMGWCLVIKKESLDKILPFDELFDMYYQDNDYAMMLQNHGIKHALVRNSIACHLETVNIPKMTEQKLQKMTIDELKFRKKWNL